MKRARLIILTLLALAPLTVLAPPAPAAAAPLVTFSLLTPLPAQLVIGETATSDLAGVEDWPGDEDWAAGAAPARSASGEPADQPAPRRNGPAVASRFRTCVRGTKLLMATARFAPELRSATDARRFVEAELRPAGVGDDTLLHAQLLVTELVTNAARHAQSPVDLTVASGQGLVRIEARDYSSAIPTAPRVDTQTRHRGLQLIEDLSEGWGVEVRGDDEKIIWCELASTGLARLKSKAPGLTVA